MFMKTRIPLLAGLLLVLVLPALAQTVPPSTQEEVQKRVAIVKSEASVKEKTDALRELSFIATPDVIPELAPLLGDVRISHMVRYALEPIEDPAVDKAFREALGKLKGRALIGVIGSVGARRDCEGVQPLAPMLGDPDTVVVQAAAKALGDIGTSDAASALLKALDGASGENRLAICEGLFRCAENLGASEQGRAKAIEVYDKLRAEKTARQVRAGGLRGAILTRGDEGLPLLRESLRCEEFSQFSAATQTALEMSSPKVTEILTESIGQLPERKQILIVQTLGKRGDTSAVPALLALAKSAEMPVRLAAIDVLPALSDPSALEVLVALTKAKDAPNQEAAEAAMASLAVFPGKEADAAAMAMQSSDDAATQLDGTELIGLRRMTGCLPALLKAASGSDAALRVASLKKVGELGGPAEVAPLLDLLTRLSEPQDLKAVEKALIAVTANVENPEASNGEIIGQKAKANSAQKAVLLSVLGATKGADALEALRGEAKNSDAEVRGAALDALVGWKSEDVAPDLLALARTAPSASEKIKALRGYIDLIPTSGISVEKQMEMAKAAGELAQRDEEKKLLIGALGSVPSPQALSMVLEHLGDAATGDEAAMAALAVSGKIYKENPKEASEALTKVLQATNDEKITERAKAILDEIKKAATH